MRSSGGSPAAAGFLAAVAAASMFAWLGPLSRWAYDGGMEPLSFVVWRAGVALAVLAAIVLATRARHLRRRPGWGRLGRAEAGWLGVATAMGLALNLAVFGAFERVTVAVALIGFYTYPAMIAATAVVLGRERPSRTVALALVLALGGMVVVVAGGIDGGVTIDGLGVLLALVGAASQTVFVTTSRGFARVPADAAITVVLAGIVAGGLAIAIATGSAVGLDEPLRAPALLPVVIAAGAVGAAIPSVLFLTAIRRIGGTRAGILMLLEPVVGVGLAALLLGEGLTPVQVGGGAAVLGAALLLQRGHRPGEEGVDGGIIAAHEAMPDAGEDPDLDPLAAPEADAGGRLSDRPRAR